MAPMVHWPEVMVTYEQSEKVLFSADAFGKFGALDVETDDWACEARRYYFNICGKYGVPVQNLLKKVLALLLALALLCACALAETAPEGFSFTGGTGKVTISNTNKYTGGTILEGGTLSVSSLANDNGVEYGALGGMNSTITLRNGGTLDVSESTLCSQPLLLGTEGGTVAVVTGKTLTLNAAVTQNEKAALHKTGTGRLQIDGPARFSALYLDQGSVQGGEADNKHLYPDTVVINGGSLKDPDNIYSYSTNNTTIVVPEGKKGSWVLDSRCDYKGRLLGKGELSVVVTSVRCNMQGDWRNFEGTIDFQRSKTGSYDPLIQWNNTKGLGKATVKGDFDNSGNEVTIGTLVGNANLTGSGRYSVKHVNIVLSKTRGGLSNPSINVERMLLITDDITVTHNGRELALGDQVSLWHVGSLSVVQGIAIHLPELPEGLYWDTTDLLTANGVLRVTNDSSVGISTAIADSETNRQIYTIGGVKLEEPQRSGIYIVNGKKVYIKK